MSDVDEFLRVHGESGKVSDDDRSLVLEQLKARRWDDLGVLEAGDRLLFPSKIWHRNPKTGAWEGDDVLLRVPRGGDLRRARAEARELAKESKIDEKVDAQLFDDLETMCVLWWATRSTSPPYEPKFGTAREFEDKYDRPAIDQLAGQLAQFRRVVDPQVSGLSADELAALTAAIVERQSLAPLLACDGATQALYVITLARLHQAYLTARSSAGPSGSSPPG